MDTIAITFPEVKVNVNTELKDLYSYEVNRSYTQLDNHIVFH